MRHDAGEPLGLRGSKECKVGRFAYRRLRSVFGFPRFDRHHLELVARGPKPEQQAALRASRFLSVSSVAATSVDDLEYLPDMNWRRNGNSFITSFDFLPGGILRPPLNLILVSGTIIEGAR
jgi:hypothetical protein